MTTPLTCVRESLTDFYLGTPGAMRRLITASTGDGLIDAGYSVPLSRGEQVHELSDGGVSVSMELNARRTWGLSSDGLSNDDAQLLQAFYLGAFGLGPFCLVDPLERNQMRQDPCTFGYRTSSATSVPLGWDKSSGTLITDFAQAPAVAGSGVARWSGAGNGSSLIEGTYNASGGEASARYACPILSDQPMSMTWYAKTSTSTASVTPQIAQRDGAGGLYTNTSAANVTLTTTWQRLSVTLAAGAAAAAAKFGVIRMVCNTATAPDILLSNAQIQYDATPDPWVLGLGVARVLLTKQLDRTQQWGAFRDVGFEAREI